MEVARYRELEDENRTLAMKLELLNDRKQNAMKGKVDAKIMPINRKVFNKTRQDFTDLSSSVDFKKTQEKRKNKIETLKRKKEEDEMLECTFKPRILENSKAWCVKQGVKPIYERETGKKRVIVEDKEQIEYEQMMETIRQRHGGKFNPDFIRRQEDYTKKKNVKVTKKQVQDARQFKRDKLIPKTNRKVNRRLDKREGDFLDRVEYQKEKKDKKMTKLDRKYYKHSFKPKLNKPKNHSTEYTTKPGIYQRLKPKHLFN